MRKDKNEAIVMRKGGMSYSEIASRMAVPKSTLSHWFRDQKWSNDIAIECAKRSRNMAAIRLTVLNTIRGNRLKKIYEEARQDALVDFHELKYHPLFISGIMLYWAHGNKTSQPKVLLSSTDPAVINLFMLFLEKVCRVEKIKVQLMIPENAIKGQKDEGNAYFEFWSNKCGFKPENYLKSVKGKPKLRQNKPYFGVCNIIVNSAYLKNKILKWIDLIVPEISQEKYLAGIV